LAQRNHLDPAIRPVCVLAGVQDDGFVQARAEPVFQETKITQILAADAGTGFDVTRSFL
jgi:hypothetical protein